MPQPSRDDSGCQLTLFLLNPPERCKEAPGPLLAQIQTHGLGFAPRPEKNTSWWKATAPVDPQPPPFLTFDDIMSVVTMGAFCFPEIGAGLATGADALRIAADNLQRRVQFYVDQEQPKDATSDPLETLGNRIADHIDQDFAKNTIGTAVAAVIRAEEDLQDIFEDLKKFKVSGRHDKNYCVRTLKGYLEPASLEQAISVLWHETGLPSPSALATSPTFTQYAFAVWLHGAAVVINATLAYALVRVFPAEAWTNEAWKIGDAKPDIRTLISKDSGASYAFQRLRVLLAETGPGSFYSHLDTADEMYRKILERLNDVTVETGKAKYLNASAPTTQPVTGSILEGITDVGKIPRHVLSQVVSAQGNQSIVRDKQLCSEDWTLPFRNYKTTLTITYLPDPRILLSESLGVLFPPLLGLTGLAGLSYEAAIALLNSRASPAISEDDGHTAVTWGPAGNNVQQDAMAWANRVANTYFDGWNYPFDREKTLVHMVEAVRTSWCTIRGLAESAK
jgi:hypothetical protein